MEVLAHRVILDVIPTHGHTEAQPAAREKVDIGGLAGHERRLTLRKYQDSGGERDPFGDGGQIGEHDERVMEWVGLVIGAHQWWCSSGVNCSENVVVSQDVIKTQVLDCSSEFPNCGGIAAKLDLRVGHTNVHER